MFLLPKCQRLINIIYGRIIRLVKGEALRVYAKSPPTYLNSYTRAWPGSTRRAKNDDEIRLIIASDV